MRPERDGLERRRPRPLSLWRRLPNTSFGIGMGLAGQAVLWKAFATSGLIHDIPFSKLPGVNPGTGGLVFWTASLLISALLLLFYILKMIFHWPLVLDELRDGSRVHFSNMPHLILLLLTIGVPEELYPFLSSSSSIIPHAVGRQVCYGIALASQLIATSMIYESWMFSANASNTIGCAQPQFLLSTIGWFLLAVLGSMLDVEERWGLALPSFCLGIGLVTYMMVVISIFYRIHETPRVRGSPALFLLIAPPSMGTVAWDLIAAQQQRTAAEDADGAGGMSMGAQLLFGWCLGLVLLLFRLGPSITKGPPVLGIYWAYVFPLAALATAAVRYASATGTMASKILASGCILVSVFALAVVYVRMYYHAYMVVCGREQWGDPLIFARAAEGEQEEPSSVPKAKGVKKDLVQ